jgi:hypothetical protein
MYIHYLLFPTKLMYTRIAFRNKKKHFLISCGYEQLAVLDTKTVQEQQTGAVGRSSKQERQAGAAGRSGRQ